MLKRRVKHANMHPVTGIDILTEFQGHHFFNNLLKLIHGACIAEDY